MRTMERVRERKKEGIFTIQPIRIKFNEHHGKMTRKTVISRRLGASV